MTARTLALTDPSLEAAIRSSKRGPALWFVCPICLEANGGKRPGVHSHMIPFNPGGQGRDRAVALEWSNPSGSTLADLTLTPSYLAGGNVGRCRFHCFVTAGKLKILGDCLIRWKIDPETNLRVEP